jgi:DNA-binding NarL/FixJ family response regulator
MDSAISSTVSRVYLVDAAVEVRQRLARLLGAIAGVEIAGEPEDEAPEGSLASDADIAVLDLRLAGGNSLGLIEALSRTQPSVIKIVLTNHTARVFRDACVTAGVEFFFDKTSQFDAACRTIKAIAQSRNARADARTGADHA